MSPYIFVIPFTPEVAILFQACQGADIGQMVITGSGLSPPLHFPLDHRDIIVTEASRPGHCAHCAHCATRHSALGDSESGVNILV